MIELLKIDYKRNKVTHILCIIIMSFNMFLIMNLIIDITNEWSYKNLISMENSDDMYYLSMNANISGDFFSLIQKIESEYSNAECGYSVNAKVSFDNQQDGTIYYLNPVLQEMTYQLKKGTWFTNNTGKEVIVGGSLAKEYAIGEKIVVTTGLGESVTETVVGHLKQSYVINFDTAGDDLTMPLLVRADNSICLTNDNTILEWYDVQYSRLGLILKSDSLLDNSNNDYGYVENFTKIGERTSAFLLDAVSSSGILQIALVASSIMSILILVNYMIDNSMDFLVICYTCGVRNKQLHAMELIEVLVDYIIAVFICIVMRILISNPDKQAGYNEVYVQNIGLFFLIYLLLLLLIGYFVVAWRIQNKIVDGESKWDLR